MDRVLKQAKLPVPEELPRTRITYPLVVAQYMPLGTDVHWRDIGTEPPKVGRQLKNWKLSEALGSEQLSFSANEFGRFHVEARLTAKHFIKASLHGHDHYFQPSIYPRRGSNARPQQPRHGSNP